MLAKGPAPIGLAHIALRVERLEACEAFYKQILGMKVVWRPDADNVYLSSGFDNLALHRASKPIIHGQTLDHIGFVFKNSADIDQWYEVLKGQEVKILQPPKQHRDGSRSLYCQDPEGIVIQLIFLP